jgi:glutamate racemase
MIGIFDSGIGGFTVVREMMRRAPEYQILYFGDTARTPYGQKGAETIKQYAVEDAEFLLSRGAKIIIIACNTVSAVAYDYLCEKFPGVPIFEVITPAAEAAARATKNGRIGVIGTRATIGSGIYEQKIKNLNPKSEARNPKQIQNPNDQNSKRFENLDFSNSDLSRISNFEFRIFSVPCPLFVPLVEEGWLDAKETKQIIRKYLHPLKQSRIDTLILGCTHYPLIKDAIRAKIGRKVKIIDSAEEVVGKILMYLQNHPEIDKNLTRGTAHQFFLSDLTPAAELTVKKWLGQNIKLNITKL